MRTEPLAVTPVAEPAVSDADVAALAGAGRPSNLCTLGCPR
jgi:hypothetical protein